MIEITGGLDKAPFLEAQRECLLLHSRLTAGCVTNQDGKIILRFAGRERIAIRPKTIPRYDAACRIPSVWAILTRSANDFAAIFFIICPRWIFTVISATPILAAICLFMSPAVTSAITSCSREVRGAKRGGKHDES